MGVRAVLWCECLFFYCVLFCCCKGKNSYYSIPINNNSDFVRKQIDILTSYFIIFEKLVNIYNSYFLVLNFYRPKVYDHCTLYYIGIVESTVHGLHGPPPSGRSLFTCRVAGDQIELN